MCEKEGESLGVLLALFEQLGIIQAFQGKTNLSVGTVAAGECRRVQETVFVEFSALVQVGRISSSALKCVWQPWHCASLFPIRRTFYVRNISRQHPHPARNKAQQQPVDREQ